MSVQQVFRTKSGMVFDDKLDAAKQDEKEFQAWLESQPSINVNDFLECANTDSDGYDSDYDRAAALIREYWSNSW